MDIFDYGIFKNHSDEEIVMLLKTEKEYLTSKSVEQ